jgi:hypothetical protein
MALVMQNFKRVKRGNLNANDTAADPQTKAAKN